MSAYDNDPRVVRINEGQFWLPDGNQRWRVMREGQVWNAYDQYDQYDQWFGEASRKDTADEAIAAIIGDPR